MARTKRRAGKRKGAVPTKGVTAGNTAQAGDDNDDDETEYVIESILDSRVSKDKGFDYLVHWRGYPHSVDSWEPWEEVEECAVYMEFRAKHLRERHHHFPPPSAHRDKPTPKKRRGFVDIDARSTRSQSTPPPIPTSIFDMTANPNLLSLIISYASPSTVAVLLRCSKTLHKAAAPTLYRNLRTTAGQIAELVARGSLASQPSSSLAKRSGAYTETLRESLQHVRTLELLNYKPGTKLPPVPRGGMADLDILVLNPTSEWYVAGDHGVPGMQPPKLGGTKSSRLVVKVASDCPNPLSHSFGKLPTTMTDITLIFPNAGTLPYPPRCSLPPMTTRTPERIVTMVFLPTPLSKSARGSWVPSADGHWKNFPSGLIDGEQPNSAKDICFVGAEYFGYTEEDLSRLSAELERQTEATVSFVPFVEWLDGAGPVFTEREEEELRRLDGEFVAWARRRVEEAKEQQIVAS